jgi:ABC-type nitrate/sulfonate/bicarbonate transport system substrate-binding protein
MRRSISRLTVVCVAAVITLCIPGVAFAGGGTEADDTADSGEYVIPESEIILGNYPVFDLAPWVAAEHWGYLDDMNITLEHRVFPDERSGLQALASGTSQLQLMGDLSLVGVAPTFDGFRAVFVPSLFQGFAPLIRPDGGLKTLEEMKMEISDPAEALRVTCAQVAGKVWVAQLGASHETTVDATLENAGLTRDDLTFIDVGPAEGAAAFLRGEGDIYLGDVPNRYRLEEEGMIPMLTAADLGQKAAVYISIVGDADWLSVQANEDALLRLILVWYKALDELKAGGPRAEEAFEVVANWVNDGAGTSFSADAAKFVFHNIYIPQPSLNEMEDTFFAPNSPFNWSKRLVWGVKVRAEQGQIEEGEVDPASVTVNEELFEKLIAYKEEAEAAIRSGGPNVELVKEYYDAGYYLDAALASRR